ncbi:Metallo-dependent phosphatase [Hypomontagnella monticulosa]|nr:Metallo-dependent phosphatase [Hypomontagnella monticulosa]
MGRQEPPPAGTQRRKIYEHQALRRALIAIVAVLTIINIALFWYRYSNPSYLLSPMAHENNTPKSPLMNPPLLASLPASALPKPHAGPSSPRLIIIGDVHGQLSALDALLKKVGFSAARDQVIFTGDMVNKGPDSGGVVDRAREIAAWGVRGNHEERVLGAWARAEEKKSQSQSQPQSHSEIEEEAEKTERGKGKHKAKDSKTEAQDYATAASLTPAQRAWLAKLPVILQVGTVSPYFGNVLVVHAGLAPGAILEKQDPWVAMNMRTLITSTPFLESAGDAAVRYTPSEGREGRPWAEVWDEMQRGKEVDEQTGAKRTPITVVYGHDAKAGLSVRRYAFGLDSGCVKGGELTALVFEATGPDSASTSTFPEEQNDEEKGAISVHEQAEAAKHGIIHRLVSVRCEAAVPDDEKGGKKDKKDKDKSKDKKDGKEKKK